MPGTMSVPLHAWIEKVRITFLAAASQKLGKWYACPCSDRRRNRRARRRVETDGRMEGHQCRNVGFEGEAIRRNVTF